MKIYIIYYYQVFSKWLYQHFTKQGIKQRKDEIYYSDAIAGFKATQTTKEIVKNKVFKDASMQLKPKKILGFNKGKSIEKPKTTKHKLHVAVNRKNKEILKATDQKFKKSNLEVVDA